MKGANWLGLGAAVAIALVVAWGFVPTSAPGSGSLRAVVDSSTTTSPQPAWNTGNLCNNITYGPGPGDVTCLSFVSNAPYPLWWNFSAGKQTGGTVQIYVFGSNDCINLNFHSFDTTLNLDLKGTGYSCGDYQQGGGGGGGWLPALQLASPEWHKQGNCSGGGGGWGVAEWGNGGGHHQQCPSPPGVNVVVNSEGDVLNLVQEGGRCGSNGNYATNITVYGTSTFVNATLGGSGLNTTVTYIGTTAGFAKCPSGITAGRVSWNVVADGNRNTFNTIFVDSPTVHKAPPTYGYSTEALAPPDGTSYGYGNLYGNETTTTAPAGSCAYLGT